MKFLLLGILLISQSVWAQKSKSEHNHRLDLFPLAIQSRYQDTSQQTRDFTIWNSFSLNYSYQFLNFGLEMNQFHEESGTSALFFKTKTSDFLLSVGYQFLRIDDLTKEKASFLLRAEGYIGQNQVTINRTVSGVESTENADPDLVVGLGAVATGRFFKYLVTEVEARFLYAKNSNPQIIPVQTLRLGVGFGF